MVEPVLAKQNQGKKLRINTTLFGALLLIAGFAGNAQAALSVGDSYVGPASLQGSLNSSGETVFSNAFSSGFGGFQDAFTFAVTTASQISALASAPALPPAFQINSFEIAVVEGGVVGTTFSGGQVKAVGSVSGSGALELSYSNLAANTQYALVVLGEVASGIPGFYGGSAEVSAVPLPSAALLFLSSLLALAGVVRQRRKKSGAIKTSEQPA